MAEDRPILDYVNRRARRQVPRWHRWLALALWALLLLVVGLIAFAAYERWSTPEYWDM